MTSQQYIGMQTVNVESLPSSCGQGQDRTRNGQDMATVKNRSLMTQCSGHENSLNITCAQGAGRLYVCICIHPVLPENAYINTYLRIYSIHTYVCIRKSWHTRHPSHHRLRPSAEICRVILYHGGKKTSSLDGYQMFSPLRRRRRRRRRLTCDFTNTYTHKTRTSSQRHNFNTTYSLLLPTPPYYYGNTDRRSKRTWRLIPVGMVG